MGLLGCFRFPRSSRSSSADSLLDEKRDMGDMGDDDCFAEESATTRFAAPHKTSKGADSADQVHELRKLMQDERIDAYVIPTADAHSSEYVGDCDKRRQWVSGFTGSAGTAVVTQDGAHLFTDSRYYVQAAKELDSKLWTLHKVGLSGVKDWAAWLLDVPDGSIIGVDSTTISYDTAQRLLQSFKGTKLSLNTSSKNLVDHIWGDERPRRQATEIHLHPLKFCGKSAEAKISELRSWLVSSKHGGPAPSFLLTTLPQIAWLFNLRAQDISFNPFFYAFAIVPASPDDLFTLWIQEAATTDTLERAVKAMGGQIRSYRDAIAELKGCKDVLSDGSISWAAAEAVGKDNLTIVPLSPVVEAEAIKNQVEIEGFKRAYLRDAVAWTKWAAWLEELIVKKSGHISEFDAAEELTKYRMRGENFAGLAYENISATGENAALPHYAPSPKGSAVIQTTTPYLNDSGAQYLEATIDTTRTCFFGASPSPEHKRAFTRVLQGHIAIDSCVFPEGASGATIDVLARRALWLDGYSYSHGTGHGIGQYLGVHEGPQGISSSQTTPLREGHVLSNEPGFYEQGSFGIRLESVVFVKEVTTRRQFGDKKWLGFERLTMIPIQSTKLVDYSLLSRDEKAWLERHNSQIHDTLLPLVRDDARAVKWLKRQ